MSHVAIRQATGFRYLFPNQEPATIVSIGSHGFSVLELRESRSRPDNGIVIFEHRAFNQSDELVAVCKRSALMLRKPGA